MNVYFFIYLLMLCDVLLKKSIMDIDYDKMRHFVK